MSLLASFFPQIKDCLVKASIPLAEVAKQLRAGLKIYYYVSNMFLE